MKNMKKFIVDTFVKVLSSHGFWAAVAFVALVYLLISGDDEGCACYGSCHWCGRR